METLQFCPAIASMLFILTNYQHSFSFFIQLWGETAIILECTKIIHPQSTACSFEYLVVWHLWSPSSISKKNNQNQTTPGVPFQRSKQISCVLFQKVCFKLVFWNKELTEQYFHTVSGTFIMPSIIIVPSSNRNFIMYSNWWAESLSSHNKLNAAGFIKNYNGVKWSVIF